MRGGDQERSDGARLTHVNEPAPLYRRVKDHILGHIRSGAWAPGQRVPSENELAGHFRISRMTANRALNELTAGGFLARVPGVGTFVKEPRARSSLLELRNIAEEIGARGHAHSAEIEAADRVMASAALAEEFGSLLFHAMPNLLERIRKPRDK